MALLKKVQTKAEYLRELLRPLADLPHVGDIRQMGMMVGIELVKDKETRRPYDPPEKVGIRVIEEARRLRVRIILSNGAVRDDFSLHPRAQRAPGIP